MNEEDQIIYIEENCKKLVRCSYSGSYFLHDEEYGEPIEYTEDELIQDGVYLNEYCIQQ
tara:strand:+ start:152 stop:328 length:177 start_codon:yes stop_codon:yes gene_type:complete